MSPEARAGAPVAPEDLLGYTEGMRHDCAFLAVLFALGAAWPVAAEPSATFSLSPQPLEESAFAWLPPHQPWVAGGLSLALNGTGQFYNHERAKGWWLLVPVLAYPAAWLLDAALGVGYCRFGDAVLILGTKVYSVMDAYQGAERAERRP